MVYRDTNHREFRICWRIQLLEHRSNSQAAWDCYPKRAIPCRLAIWPML